MCALTNADLVQMPARNLVAVSASKPAPPASGEGDRSQLAISSRRRHASFMKPTAWHSSAPEPFSRRHS
jgi:hypothetical protein